MTMQFVGLDTKGGVTPEAARAIDELRRLEMSAQIEAAKAEMLRWMLFGSIAQTGVLVWIMSLCK